MKREERIKRKTYFDVVVDPNLKCGIAFAFIHSNKALK